MIVQIRDMRLPIRVQEAMQMEVASHILKYYDIYQAILLLIATNIVSFCSMLCHILHVLCYIKICHAILFHIKSYIAMLSQTGLWYAILCVSLCHIELCYAIVCHNMSHYGLSSKACVFRAAYIIKPGFVKVYLKQILSCFVKMFARLKLCISICIYHQVRFCLSLAQFVIFCQDVAHSVRLKLNEGRELLFLNRRELCRCEYACGYDNGSIFKSIPVLNHQIPAGWDKCGGREKTGNITFPNHAQFYLHLSQILFDHAQIFSQLSQKKESNKAE